MFGFVDRVVLDVSGIFCQCSSSRVSLDQSVLDKQQHNYPQASCVFMSEGFCSAGARRIYLF